MIDIADEFKINRLEQFIMAAGYCLPSMGCCDEVEFVHPVDEIKKLTEQNKMLREALAFCEPHADWALQGQMFNKGIAAAKKILEATKC